MIANPGFYARHPRPALDHRVGVHLRQGDAGQQPRTSAKGAEQRPLRIMRHARPIEVACR